jgi:hypothetical protein
MARLRGGDLAGLAGLGAAAYLLSKKKGDSAAFEREEDVGGLRSSGESGSDAEEVSVAAPKKYDPVLPDEPMSDEAIRSKIERASPAKYAGGEGGPARRAARAAVFGGGEGGSGNTGAGPRTIAEARRQREIRTPTGALPKGFHMKKGGSVSSASKRADGIAQRGKTKGRYV